MTNEVIIIESRTENAKVRIRDVVMIERVGRKLRIVTENRNFYFYEKMENVAAVLGEEFYPCLKGCYINFDRVERMSEQCIFFDNGQVYSLGRENFMRTKRDFTIYLKKIEKSKQKSLQFQGK